MRKRNLMIALFLSMAVLFLCQTGLASPLFNATLDFKAGEMPHSVAIGDLDGDGAMDLAVANLMSNNVSVLLGNGNGTFRSAVNYGAGEDPSSVAISDLNADGDLDLAVANRDSATVSVLLGNGDGTFRSAVDYGAGGAPSSIALGDLDADGVLDMTVANGNNVSVLLGNGDGTFQSAVNYGAGGAPHSVAIGDLDGDGALDMTVANFNINWGSYNVSVLLDNGDGTFRSNLPYAVGMVGDQPLSVAIGDLDGNGSLDLAVANAGSNNVSVLLGNGDGTFRSTVNYGTGDEPQSVVIGDLDGDGVMDLAVANVGNVSVLINALDRVETVYPKGWSMMSLPVNPLDKRLKKLFPGAAVVYDYEQGTGYVRVKPGEKMEVGKGYWMLLNEEKTYTLIGHPIPSYTYPVSSYGWVMIGGCSSLARVSPNNCNIGVIYEHIQGIGYQQLVTSEYLEPGKGYWMLLKNVTDPASLTVQGTGE